MAIRRFFKRESKKSISYNRQVWEDGKHVGNFSVPVDQQHLDDNLIKELSKLKVGQELPVNISNDEEVR